MIRHFYIYQAHIVACGMKYCDLILVSWLFLVAVLSFDFELICSSNNVLHV